MKFDFYVTTMLAVPIGFQNASHDSCGISFVSHRHSINEYTASAWNDSFPSANLRAATTVPAHKTVYKQESVQE